MKKILICLVLMLCNPLLVSAQDEVELQFSEEFKRLVINDTHGSVPNNLELPQETQIITPQILLDSNSVDTHSRFFNGISQTARSIYNLQVEQLDAPKPLLSEALTKHYEHGLLESFHTWGVVQSNFDTIMTEGENGYTKFNPALVNVLFDGKFKGGKEGFRLMLDPSHQHNRPFMQQIVQDAYFETKRIPHHTIMFGNSRTGTGYEGAQSPYTLPFINRSQISRNLANIRKVGLRVKGCYPIVEYDFGGYSSDTFFTEFMPGVEFDGWVNLKPLAKTNGKYGNLTTGGGIVSGTRNSVDYFVGGAYVGYEYKKFWTRMEYAVSDGSNGGSGLTTKRRQGWYVTLGYHITKSLNCLQDMMNLTLTKLSAIIISVNTPPA